MDDTIELLNQLTDPQYIVRCQTALDLGNLGAVVAIDGLVNMALSDPDARARAIAVHALGYIDHQRCTDFLIERLLDDTELPDVRAHAAEALTYQNMAHRSRILAALLRAIHDNSIDVRFWTIYALGETGDKQHIPLLQQIAETDQGVVANWWSIRDEAMDSIRHIAARSND